MDVLSDMRLWVAILSGGVAVKLLDFVLPAIFNRKEKTIKVAGDERESLRSDIEYLRTQVDDLRREVEKLREEISVKDREVSAWRHRYWEKRVQLDRVLLQIKHHPDNEMKRKIHDILSAEDIVILDKDEVE